MSLQLKSAKAFWYLSITCILQRETIWKPRQYE